MCRIEAGQGRARERGKQNIRFSVVRQRLVVRKDNLLFAFFS